MLHPERRRQNREAIDLRDIMDKIEKVKHGLRCIAQIGECDCDHCDYADNGHPSVLYKCQEKFASDALAVIEEQQDLIYAYKHACQSCKSRLEGVKPF